MKSFIIFALSLLLYPVCSEGVRPIKKNISPPLSLDYSVKNYLDSGDRSTEIGIAISKQNLISNKKLPVVVFIHGGGGKQGIKIKIFGSVLTMRIKVILQSQYLIDCWMKPRFLSAL